VFVRFTSMMTNESLFWVAAGWMLYYSIALERNRFRWNHALGFSLVTVLALYIKLSALMLLPVPLLVWLTTYRRKVSVPLAAYAIIAILTVPLWWRNLHDFGGLIPVSAGFGAPVLQIPFLHTSGYALRSFIFPWHELWAGWLGIAFMLPLGVIMLGNLPSGFRIIASSRALFFSGLVTAFAFLWLNLHYNQAEARYLFAAWPAVSLLAGGNQHSGWQLTGWTVALSLPYLLFFLPLFGV
jgi:hypothetical protein